MWVDQDFPSKWRIKRGSSVGEGNGRKVYLDDGNVQRLLQEQRDLRMRIEEQGLERWYPHLGVDKFTK